MARNMRLQTATEAAKLRAKRTWLWIQSSGLRAVTFLVVAAARQLRRNLVPRRLFSLPHGLVAVWIIILLWGERWVFDSKVENCNWDRWESWPRGARAHHLVFIADPQIVDPHTYPGRPWPLSSLTVTITDNYLSRGYRALQRRLRPDSVFFLGDLFDGGREWKTRQEGFVDPKWGVRKRPSDEEKLVDTWHRRYGEDFWVKEYQRFSKIFFDNFKLGDGAPGPDQPRRRLVASLPGNHDLGFGAQVQLPVRDRFSAFFGDPNRVDVVGNHSIVSVDTVSLSADTSQYKDTHDLEPIYGPANNFLKEVQSIKRKAAMKEIEMWHDVNRDVRFKQQVNDLESHDPEIKSDPEPPTQDPGEGHAELPTILLTHVPLYRNPGTPCGPQREHWPPTKRPKGQVQPVNPDERNAIPIVAGYQYQNVLTEEDSVKLIKSIGNVVHVFSGDDHDYCEVIHSQAKDGVREITVKAMSMAMGVPTPGFLMLSMYNPIDADGRRMPGAPEKTLQTHLCLLPNQAHTYTRYFVFFVLSLGVLAVRAALVPILSLTPFALEPDKTGPAWLLPVFKDKTDPPDTMMGANGVSSHDMSSTRRLTASAAARTVSHSTSSSSGSSGQSSRWTAKKKSGGKYGGAGGRWSWAADDYDDDWRPGPRIRLDTDFYDDSRRWRAGRRRQVMKIFGRELWTTAWRVMWMTVLVFVYLTRRG